MTLSHIVLIYTIFWFTHIMTHLECTLTNTINTHQPLTSHHTGEGLVGFLGKTTHMVSGKAKKMAWDKVFLSYCQYVPGKFR